ncbi:MAG: thiamine pyrophosphate-binding protein [Candidatus Neomarinimicrobiota bacterium]
MDVHAHGGALVARVLKAQGVQNLFTLCGGHISPILVAAKELGIRVIDVRHEATAVFAADAVARLCGIPGVAVVTAGPGVTNTVTAVKNAQLAQSPLVLIGGATATVLKNRGALQDIDQKALFKPHVKWLAAPKTVRQIVPTLESAFRLAREGVPGPVFVELPVDLLYPEELVRQWYLGEPDTSVKQRSLASRIQKTYLRYHMNRLFAGQADESPAPPAVSTIQRPSAAHIKQAAVLLETAQRPLMIVGSQALLAPAEVKQPAKAIEGLGIPVYLAGMARGLLGPDHPLQCRHQRRQALKEADLVILAGMPCDFRLNYGRQIPRSAILITVNRDKGQLRLNRRPKLAIHADPALFLWGLSDLAGWDSGRWPSWLVRLRRLQEEGEKRITTHAEERSDWINPLRLLREIDASLAPKSLIVADGGDFVATASYTVRPRGPLSWLDPGVFGTLGVGAGFALGAKLCRPEAEVWILYGDGAVGFSLMELDTFVRHGLPVIAVVGNDGGWTQIAREQVPLLKDDVGTTLARIDYHIVAEGLGARGYLLDNPADIPDVLAAARAAIGEGKPVLINALIGKTGFRKGAVSI